jgi:hypothetical protein
MRQMKKHLQTFWLISITCIFFLIGQSVQHTSAQNSQKQNPNEYANRSFFESQALYHLRMNQIFNQKTELLISKKGKESENCNDEKNISTLCLSKKMLDEHFKYREALTQMISRTEEPFTIDQTINQLKTLGKGNTETLKTEFQKQLTNQQAAQSNLTSKNDYHTSKIELINQELINSRRTMDKALSAYHELRSAYPMHTEFRQTITNLSQLNQNLKKLRGIIESYPSKFHNATSIVCQ